MKRVLLIATVYSLLGCQVVWGMEQEQERKPFHQVHVSDVDKFTFDQLWSLPPKNNKINMRLRYTPISGNFKYRLGKFSVSSNLLWKTICIESSLTIEPHFTSFDKKLKKNTNTGESTMTHSLLEQWYIPFWVSTSIIPGIISEIREGPCQFDLRVETYFLWWKCIMTMKECGAYKPFAYRSTTRGRSVCNWSLRIGTVAAIVYGGYKFFKK